MLNQQSYPTVGQTWVVHFEAGGGILRVSGYDGTVLGDGPDADVSFEYLTGPDGGRTEGLAGDNWVEFGRFGPGTGSLAVTVNTPGAHHLRLQSGSAASSAHNWAYPELASKIPGVSAGAPTLPSDGEFGKSLSRIGDIDGDGVQDVAVGAENASGQSSDRGAVHVLFMNSDGTVKKTTEINSSTPNGPSLADDDEFGVSVAGIGDIDGDGVPDIAVGAKGDDEGGDLRGTVHVITLHSYGGPKKTTEINSSTPNGPSLADGDEFGTSVAGVGDIDGDGTADIAVGAPGDDSGVEGASGAVHIVFMNSDGTAKKTAEIDLASTNGPLLTTFDFFGSSVSGLGDMNGDGTPDVVAGARGDDLGGASRGALHVMFMNSDGTVQRTAEINSTNGPILANYDELGHSVAAIGDIDGDGTADMAAGTPSDGTGGLNTGTLHLFLMNSDGTVKRAAEINSTTANGPSIGSLDQFGYSVSGMRDIDGDGVPDIAVGANGAGVGLLGTMYVIFLQSDMSVKSSVVMRAGAATGPALSAGDDFGKSAARVGDLDGDGTGDIAVGARSDDAGGTNRGAVHVLFMRPDGVPHKTAEINSATPNGPSLADNDGFGSSAAGIGDLDRDGVSDLAVGAPGDDAGGSGRGAVHVLFLNSDGSVKRTAEINSATPNGPSLADNDGFGSSAAGIGDLDRDGVPDIAVGAPGDDAGGSGRGAVHVLFLNSDGSVKRTAEINSATPNGPSLADNDEFGFSAAGMGDPDGDGVPDIAVGAPGDDAGGSGRGAVHVLFLNSDGSVKRTAEINSATPNGPSLADGDEFGSSAAGIGDVDGDGTQDVAAGAPGDDAGGSGRGAVHILFLNPDGSVKQAAELSSSTLDILSLENSDAFGSSVALVGDMDRDGEADLVAGAQRAGPAGTLYVIRLDAIVERGNGLAEAVEKASNSTSILLSPSSGDQFGRAAANVGDLNGDGFAELAVGAPYDGGGGTDRGAISILFTKLDGTIRTLAKIDSSTPNGPSLADNDEFGYSAAGIGDLDGDGVPDMAVGARGDDAGGTWRGAVHVLFLNSDGTVKRTAEINSTTTNGPSLADDDTFGSSVAGIGDLDGDGVTEIAAGAPKDDDGHSNRGVLHVLFLNSDGTVKRTAEINSATPNGPSLADNDNFGSSAAGIGDLDGDGVPDVAAGAWGDDAGGSQRGAVHIMYMNSDGTVKRTAEINSLTPNGPSLTEGDFFGYSVAAVGDLDGDGNADIASGAVGDDAGGNSRGALHVMFLNSDGTVKRTAEINSATPNGPSLASASFFGSSVAVLGDLDGDGTPDIAAGAERYDADSSNFGDDTGAVYIAFMKTDGAPKKTAMLEYVRRNGPLLGTGDDFGAGASGIGDVDGDGVADLAVGAPGDDGSGDGRDTGAVRVMFMDRDGMVASMAWIGAGTPNGSSLADNDNFGSSVAGIGDLDGDGVPDVAAGAPGDDAGGLSRGAVHVVLLNSDGTVKRTAEINSLNTASLSLANFDQFGSSVAGIGDLDRDGVPDMAAGARGDDAGGSGRGAVHLLYMNSDGTVKRTAEINSATPNGPSLADGDIFGSSVAGIGDLDGDGVAEIAAGAERDDGASSNASENSGALHILYMNSDGTVKKTAEISGSTANGPGIIGGDLFGAVSSAGDLDRDGTPDIAAGAPGGNEAHVMFLNSDGSVKRTVAMNSLSLPDTTLSAREGFGRSVGFAGDLNRDGAGDLVVGADDSESRGAAYVMLMSKNAVVVNATSTVADGTYGNGSAIDLLVEFSEPVSVTGTPKLELETGAADARAAYVSGSGTDVLAFRYAVVHGHSSSDLGYVGAQSLLLDGGAIVTADGSNSGAALALPIPGRAGSLSYNKDIEIDTVRPLLTGASIDLGTGTLSMTFDSDLGGRVDASGIALKDAQGQNSRSLAGASGLADGNRALVELTEAQRTDIIRDRARLAETIQDPGILMDVSDSAVRDSLGNFFAGTTSHALDVVPDTIPPERTPDAPVAGFVAGTLSVAFDEEIDAGSVATSGIALLSADRSASVVLTGATAVYSDGALRITFTDAHNRSLYDAGIASGGSALLDIGATAVRDLSGNYFAGVTGERLIGHYYVLVRDEPAVSGSHSSHTSAAASLDSPSVSDGALALRGIARSAQDSPAFSDSAVRAYMEVSVSADTAVFSDSARSYRSGIGVSSSPALSGSASWAGMRASASSDTAVFSDSARSYQSAFVSSDTAVFSDSASGANMVLSSLSDTAVFSDSARSYQSAFVSSDTAVFSDSASGANMVLSSLSDTAVFSDSARSYQSAFVSSDTAVFSDSASGANMVLSSLSDTAVFSDSVRSYQSAFVSSDTAVFSDSASGANMVISSSTDVAAFSDSARAYKSSSVSSDSPVLSDSAGRAGMRVVASSDTAVFSDSARSIKSGTAYSDSPVFSDAASVVGMRLAGLSDSATFSDSARAYKSIFAESDSPVLSDSAGRAGMRVAASADTAVFSDSARAYRSAVSATDSLAPSSSASYAGLFSQGLSDSARFSDSARALRSSIVSSDSPVFSDAASAAGMRTAELSDSAGFSDLARAYKSVLGASSAPVPSDSARWGSARAASDQSSPALSDSALARISSAARSSSPVLSDSARAGASALLLSDSPELIDGATTGSHPEIDGADLPTVSDRASYRTSGPSAQERETADPARASGGGSGRGTGGVSTTLAVIHAVSYDRCSDEPHATVTVSPSERITVTLEQPGGRTVAQQSSLPADAPDSSVWTAPVLPDEPRLQIRAVLHRGAPATGDSQLIDMESCSGFVKFTAFGAPVAGPPPDAETTSDAEPQAQTAPEPAADPPQELAELEIAPMPTPEINDAPAAIPPEPAETAAPPAPATAAPTNPDPRIEPTAEAPAQDEPDEPDAPLALYAAAAVASAALLAALAKWRLACRAKG